METMNVLEELTSQRLARQNNRRPVTQRQLLDAIRKLQDEAGRRGANGRPHTSLAKIVRGMSAMKGRAIVPETAEADVNFVRALNTSGTPGVYLTPEIQSNAIIALLADVAVARAAGATVWPMPGKQVMDIPVALTSPKFEFIGQNSAQSPSDPNLGQLHFDLSTHRALLVLPAELFRTALPAFDLLLEQFFADGMAESEDAAMFASTTGAAPAPKALMDASGVQKLTVGSDPSGGDLGYDDLTAMLEKAGTQKVRPPYSWFMAPRSLTRLLSLRDTGSHPLLVPLPPTGLPAQAAYSLFGWPIFLTNSIAIDEVNASGTDQSTIILCNARRAIQIAENSGIEMAIATERYLDSNQVCLRVGRRLAFDYVGAGIVALEGVN